MRVEAEGLILFFGWLGLFYLLVGRWRWHGGKSCLGQLKFHLMCSGGCRMSSGFHLFAADANEGNREVGWTQNQG